MHTPPLILIADDSPDFQEILSEKLKASGFSVSIARDGKEAVERATTLHPDLVLMDINMPNENGTEAVLDIKRSPEARDIKIVFFTSLDDPWPAVKGKNEALAEELGAAEFIKKSEDLSEIVENIKRILSVQ